MALSLSASPTPTPQTVLKQVSYLGSSLQANLQIPGYNRHSIAPDFSLGLFWTSATIVNIVRMSNLTIVHSWTPPNPVAGDITAKITFSSDSSLAIIKTDSINPIQIRSLIQSVRLTSWIPPTKWLWSLAQLQPMLLIFLKEDSTSFHFSQQLLWPLTKITTYSRASIVH